MFMYFSSKSTFCTVNEADRGDLEMVNASFGHLDADDSAQFEL